jgi:glycosyltransferase involved in cell wall biosynthesis
MNLYLTQDRIGTPTGGGAVTFHEYRALESLGEVHPFDNVRIPVNGDPFKSDTNFATGLSNLKDTRLAQIYSGCFTKTVDLLRKNGTKVSYTAAAHSIAESKREFEGLGLQFNLPHLTVPDLWEKYVGGYKAADLVICPSTYSKSTMEGYGCKKVVVVPHGCEMAAKVAPIPKKFVIGYLGQAGPDKGLRYLFEAWKKLNLKDGLLLVAGDNIDQALPLWRRFGGGNIEFMGFVKEISDFFDRISVYVQPSVTEGFGIEVLEAMAHGRPVICSSGAGAKDVVKDYANGLLCPARDSEKIANLIEKLYRKHDLVEFLANETRKTAEAHTWEKVRAKYVEVWNVLLASV